MKKLLLILLGLFLIIYSCKKEEEEIINNNYTGTTTDEYGNPDTGCALHFSATLEKHRVPWLSSNRFAQAESCGATLRPPSRTR